MPITRPRLSASAPPEFPGLSAASVWITSGIDRCARPLRAGSERPRADTTPAVTVPPRPWGLPIATTSWPDTEPAGVAELGGHERGRVGPDQRQVGERVAPDDLERGLAAVDEGGAAAASLAPTTCAHVSMNPSALRTTALPPPTASRRRPRRRTRRLATEGSSRSATVETIRE